MTVKTRFATNFRCAVRLLVNVAPLKSAVADSSFPTTLKGSWAKSVVEDDDFWTNLEALCDIFLPVADVRGTAHQPLQTAQTWKQSARCCSQDLDSRK